MSKSRTVIVQAIVSIPRAGEFKVGIPIEYDHLIEAPTRDQLLAVVANEVFDRLRIKLDKGELKRFIKAYTRA